MLSDRLLNGFILVPSRIRIRRIMTVFFRTCYRKVTYSFSELYLFHENAIVLFHANAVSACLPISCSRFKKNVQLCYVI